MRRFTEETKEIMMLVLGLTSAIEDKEDPEYIDNIIFGIITDLKILNKDYKKENKKDG